MLKNLIIKNLALIENLDIELDDRLNIVTGETGAGKSIMIGAVQLLFGKRADKSMIRTGSDRCDVSAVIQLDDAEYQSKVNALLDGVGVPPCEDGQLIISRRISEQSGRNFVNGVPVTLLLLKQLGELVVDIHGPYDNQSLLKTAKQLEVLDDFAGVHSKLAGYVKLYVTWRELKNQLNAAEEESPSQELLDYLKFQLREIEEAALEPGEEEELAAKHALASNSHQIIEIMTNIRSQLSEDDNNALDQLGCVMRRLIELERIDPENGEAFAQALDGIIVQIKDLDADLSAYVDGVEMDPAEFERMEERLGEIRRLKRKFGGTVESVLAHAGECRERLHKLENFDEYRAELEARVNAAEEKMMTAAGKLTSKRKAAAKKLGPQITDKLQFLGFPDCKFSIELADCPVGQTGADAIEFFFAPNPGEGNRPLRDIASSGEIARVMLALKTILAQADKVPTLIFDEVDANIGGVIANRVGDELRRLGKAHQVICITHQPQVAAGADRHLLVAKSTKKKRTMAHIEPLSADARVAEIARMLGSEDDSGVAARHARELIAKACNK